MLTPPRGGEGEKCEKTRSTPTAVTLLSPVRYPRFWVEFSRFLNTVSVTAGEGGIVTVHAQSCLKWNWQRGRESDRVI